VGSGMGAHTRDSGELVRWTVTCADDEAENTVVEVIAVGGYVALQVPGAKPVWLDRFQGDKLSSSINRAVSAAQRQQPTDLPLDAGRLQTGS
jgi:hypothetical protein